MVPESDLELGQFRLLDVDNRVVVPVDTHVRFIVTGQDVIHDFAVPSLGLKIDAVNLCCSQMNCIEEILICSDKEEKIAFS
jgi:cytochrome c oxidase subunit 2